MNHGQANEVGRISRGKAFMIAGAVLAIAALVIAIVVTSNPSTNDHLKKIESTYDVKIVKVTTNKFGNRIQIRDGGALRECDSPTRDQVERAEPLKCELVK